MRKQNLDFEVARDFFIEMKFYNSELFKKNVGMLDFVILDIDPCIIWDHEIDQNIYCVMLPCFSKKAFESLLCC